MRLHIEHHIKARAAERPTGYVKDMLSCGAIDGEWLLLDDAEYFRLIEKYKQRGLGDVLERLFSPIARLLKLQNCPACQKRKNWLNRLFL